MYHSGNSELEQLEDRHYRNPRNLQSWSGIMRICAWMSANIQKI